MLNQFLMDICKIAGALFRKTLIKFGIIRLLRAFYFHKISSIILILRFLFDPRWTFTKFFEIGKTAIKRVCNIRDAKIDVFLIGEQIRKINIHSK